MGVAGVVLAVSRRVSMLHVRTHTTGRLDDKGRLSLPSRLRSALDTHRVGSLVLVCVQGAVWAWTPEDFARIESRLDPVDPFAMESLDFTHGILATADEVDVDKSGRVRIPPELRALAGLDKEVRLFSVLDRIEIWDADRWQARFDAAREAAAARGGMPRAPEPAGEGA